MKNPIFVIMKGIDIVAVIIGHCPFIFIQGILSCLQAPLHNSDRYANLSSRSY